MNFKEFEERISNINNQIFAFFMQIEEEENHNINDVFQTLKQSLNTKKEVLFQFEQQLRQDDDLYKTKLENLESSITNLINETPALLYSLDDKRNEIKQAKQDEQNKIIGIQIRRRSEFAHRINTLNKDLANVLKERNGQLEEEDKNYKVREAELNRRMNIDLQKATELTIKASNEFEKLLLETNEPSGIAEIKKKIVALRAEGFKEQESIKNKYEFSFIENTLEFKRFYEKIVLDNALTSEDFFLKIKALEKQRNGLDFADQLKLTLFNLELDKQYNEWEKEQNLFAVDWTINNFSKQAALKKQISDEMTTKNAIKKQKYQDYQTFANAVDVSQLDSYRPLELLISNNVKKQCNYLLESLSDCIEVFQTSLISIVENTWNLKKSLRNDLSKFLLVAIKDELPLLEPHYKQEIMEIERFCIEYYKLQNKRFQNFLKAVATQTKNLLREVKTTIAIFKDYYLEEQTYREDMDKKLGVELSKGYQAALGYLDINYHKQESVIKTFDEKTKSEVEKHQLSMDFKKQLIEGTFQDQLKALNEQIKKVELDNKHRLDEEENNYQLFIKNSKIKQSSLKRDFSDNVLLHEHLLDKKYRQALIKNEKERKAKIKAL
ncbi:MAG: hypothetical protein AB7T03_03225 [Bacilli bacterium]